MLNLAINCPTEFYSICRFLENAERFQLGKTNKDLYYMLEPLFNSLSNQFMCLKKQKDFPIIGLQIFQEGYESIELKQLAEVNINASIGNFWAQHNENQITHHYIPYLIDYDTAKKKESEQRRIEILCNNAFFKFPQKVTDHLGHGIRQASINQTIRLIASGQLTTIDTDPEKDFGILCSYVKGIDEPSSNGNTALHWAIKSKNEIFAKILIEKNADYRKKNNLGQTPLHFAALWDNDSMVKLLLSKNAFLIIATDNEGKTPLDWAIEGNNSACIQALKDPNAFR
jgi:hypothetical protein